MSGDVRFKIGLLLLGLAGVAAYSFWYALKAWRANRVIGDTPASRVRSAAQGYVELLGQGLITEKSPNKAPLTSRPCTWWRYKIEERGSMGRSRGWATIDSGISEVPFILDDGTGRCLVDPRGAEVFPKAKDVWYGDSVWPDVRIPDGQGIFGKLADLLLSGGRYRYTEYRLQSHEPVCALGEFRSLGGVGAEDPDVAVTELLHQWKQDQKTLLERFDRDRDGVLNGEEWELARAAARQQVLGGMLAKPTAPTVSVLAKPADGRAFLLAASDGASLARRLRRQAFAGFAACAGSSAALAWMVAHV
ncbi:MAG: GIDE domain-containing protein [Steroidobacteraceae bacterium]